MADRAWRGQLSQLRVERIDIDEDLCHRHRLKPARGQRNRLVAPINEPECSSIRDVRITQPVFENAMDGIEVSRRAVAFIASRSREGILENDDHEQSDPASRHVHRGRQAV